MFRKCWGHNHPPPTPDKKEENTNITCITYMFPASDPGLSRGRARNMKYKAPQVAAIFSMTSFNRDKGGMPPWIRSWFQCTVYNFFFF